MKGIPFPLLLALMAAAAKARAATDPQAEACDCPGCKFRAATEKLLAARKAEAQAAAETEKARAERDAASRRHSDAVDAVLAATEEFNAAADALNAEDAKAEGGAQ